MIISDNPHPCINEFQQLMSNTDRILNADALKRPNYYANRGGNPLEDDVESALIESSKGTPFENTITKISGQRFPDIIAAGYYGVEVKSTKEDHWTSTGSSILETTRVNGIERIYMTFGKLGGNPIEFLSKPYEKCLYDIAVTHMPRYRIDMKLKDGETIFEKMGVSYDELRKMDDPIAPVARYYRNHLKPGESLWWTGNKDIENESAPATIKLWTATSSEEKERLTVEGYVLFPEVLSNTSNKKYNRYSLWLVTNKGVVNNNVRDSFSAGGKIPFTLENGLEIKMPAAYGRIKKYRLLIEDMLYNYSADTLSEYWEMNIVGNRLKQWCMLVADQAKTDPSVGYTTAWRVLESIFPSIKKDTPSEVSQPRIYNNPRETRLVAEDVTIYSTANKANHKQALSVAGPSISIGESVAHKVYGIGKIKRFENNRLTVLFGNIEKTFNYPSAFTEGFLVKL